MHRKFLAVAITGFAALTTVVLLVAHHGVKETERIVSDQFNSQQLIIAKKISGDIRQHFHFLETALLTFSHNWARDLEQGKNPQEDAFSVFELLKTWDVLAMGHLPMDEEEPTIALVGDFSSTDVGVDFNPYRQWAAQVQNRGKVLIGKTLIPESGPFRNSWIMVMVTPTHLSPSAPGFSDAGKLFSGLNFFIVDATGIAARYTRHVRSGKTGYAWIIDHKGYFMAHHEADFVGRDSITVRQQKNPLISFDRVNSLVRDHLLRGEEGMDWYISGWHAGVIAEMKKLFAYSPIFLQDDDGVGNLWSVGVVAPEEEVSGLLRSLLIRQWILAGLFLCLVFVSLSLFLYMSLRWSQTLKEEVDRKTEHLRRSESELQRETEQLKASMAKLLETQEKLIRSERFAAIGEAASHLSHEIKNPLMLIGGFARQVSRAFPEEDPNLKKLEIIESETRRLESLIDDVRDFTRPSKPQKEWCSLHDCIQETLELMEESLTAANIECETALPPAPPLICCDPRQVKQVLINLLKNAMEAMPEGGKISIVSRWDEEKMWITVTDTGRGMSEEVRERLFQPFFTTKQKGTGLGLAVCNKIIEDHHGEITVRSQEGKGTSFTFFLPLNPDDSKNLQQDA